MDAVCVILKQRGALSARRASAETMMDNTIVSMSLIAVSRIKRETDAAIHIGLPQRDGPCWACAVTVLDFDGNVYGDNPLQALALSLEMVASQLWHWVDTGGQFLHAETRLAFALAETFPRSTVQDDGSPEA